MENNVDIYIISVDIARALFITAICFIVFGVALAVNAWRHNATKMKAVKRLNVKEEIKAVFSSYVGIWAGAFVALLSLYAAESIVAKIILGAVYLALLYFIFARCRHS